MALVCYQVKKRSHRIVYKVSLLCEIDTCAFAVHTSTVFRSGAVKRTTRVEPEKGNWETGCIGLLGLFVLHTTDRMAGNNRHLLSYGSGGSKFKIKVSEGPLSLESLSGKILP